MTLWLKSVKPLRFPSLLLAFGLGGLLFAQATSAGNLRNGQDACVDKFTAEINKFTTDASLKNFPRVDVSKLDSMGGNFCAANGSAKHDLIAAEQSNRPKPKLSDGAELVTTFEGACRSSYEAVDLVFDRLLKARKETCAKVYTEIEKKFPNCLDTKPADSCKGKLDEIVALYSNGKKQLLKDVENSVVFLEKHAEWNGEAEKKFQKDLDLLKNNRNNHELLDQAVAAPPAVAFAIAAADQGADKLSTYLKNLEKNGKPSQVSAAQAEPVMSPKSEQVEAKKMVLALTKKLKEIGRQEKGESGDAQLEIFKASLRKNLDSIPGEDGYLKKLGNVAPSAAPLAGALMQKNGGNVASTVASSSTGALPALAMMGAAGAAGMAMGKKSGSSSGMGSAVGAVEGPVMTPNNKAAGTEFGGNNNDRAPAPAPTNPLATNETDRSEKNEEGNAAAGGGGALAAALGGGASAMPGKPKNSREVASAPPSAAPAGEEALKNFGGDLRPAPRPQASPDSSGNEVSNLLGKMKDLFNMDDTFGGGMPPPDLGSGEVAYPASGGSPGASEEYPGEDYGGAEEYQAEGEYEGGSEEAYQGSNPMGDIEVTLFRRVHARHVKCIEKGLVLLMSQDLPE